MWDHQRNVEHDTKDQWIGIYKKDEPNAHFHVSSKKPKHNPTMKEEIANVTGDAVQTNAVFKPMRPMARRGKFLNQETFIVSSSTFNSLREAKKKRVHWKRYLEEDDAYHDLREYARKKRKGPIIVEDERTGACMYVRYGDMK